MTLFEKNMDMDGLDLPAIAEWGLTGEFSDSGCWDEWGEPKPRSPEEQLQRAVGRAVADFNETLALPWPRGLGDMPARPLIYRFVVMRDRRNLRTANAGTSWFADPAIAESPGMEFTSQLDHIFKASERQGDIYLLTAEVDIGDIDMPRTLWLRSINSGENEIRLKEGVRLHILSVEKYS